MFSCLLRDEQVKFEGCVRSERLVVTDSRQRLETGTESETTSSIDQEAGRTEKLTVTDDCWTGLAITRPSLLYCMPSHRETSRPAAGDIANSIAGVCGDWRTDGDIQWEKDGRFQLH